MLHGEYINRQATRETLSTIRAVCAERTYACVACSDCSIENPARNMLIYGGMIERWWAMHTRSAFKIGPGYSSPRLRAKSRHFVSHFLGTRKYDLPSPFCSETCVWPRAVAGEKRSCGKPVLRSRMSRSSFEPAISFSKRSNRWASAARSLASSSLTQSQQSEAQAWYPRRSGASTDSLRYTARETTIRLDRPTHSLAGSRASCGQTIICAASLVVLASVSTKGSICLQPPLDRSRCWIFFLVLRNCSTNFSYVWQRRFQASTQALLTKNELALGALDADSSCAYVCAASQPFTLSVSAARSTSAERGHVVSSWRRNPTMSPRLSRTTSSMASCTVSWRGCSARQVVVTRATSQAVRKPKTLASSLRERCSMAAAALDQCPAAWWSRDLHSGRADDSEGLYSGSLSAQWTRNAWLRCKVRPHLSVHESSP